MNDNDNQRVKPPTLSPEEATELHIQDWREWIKRGYILRSEEFRRDPNYKVTTFFPMPTMENLTVKARERTYDNSMRVLIFIEEMIAADISLDSALTLALRAMKAELDALNHVE